MSRNTWILFIAICVALLGGLVWMSRESKINVSEVDANSINTGTDQSGGIADHIRGNKDAKVKIIEYGDYQCPGCGQASTALNTAVENKSDQVAFIFRNFPLTSIHPNARSAASAAEAAGLQNKYWEMHDWLFENQDSWNSLSTTDRTETFAGVAESIGINREQFLRDMNSDKVSQKINYDSSLGKKVGVTGTPGIYVNGKEVNQYYKDGKLVGKNEDGARQVWSNAEAFEKLILQPEIERQNSTSK